MLMNLRNKLSHRLLAFSIPIAILLAIIIYLAMQSIVNNAVTGMAVEFTKKQSLYDRSRMLNSINRDMALVQSLVTSTTMIDWMMNENNAVQKQHALNKLASYQNIFKDGSYFIVIDKSENFYFNNRADTYKGKQLRYRLSPSNPKDSWYYYTKKIKKGCQLNVDHDEHLGTTKVWINCPVYNAQDKMLGVVGTGIDLTAFINSVVESKQLGVRSIYINAQGSIQASGNIGNIDFNSHMSKDSHKTIFTLFHNDMDKSKFLKLLKNVTHNPFKTVTMRATINNKESIIAIANIPSIHWFSVTIIDINKLSLDSYFLPFALLLLLTIILIISSLVWLLNRLVLRRIQQLDIHASQIESGNYSIQTHDNATDELARLHNRFVSMAKKIKHHTHNMEQQIQERTKETNALLSNMLDVVYRSDKNGTITFITPSVERLLGFKPEEIIGNKSPGVAYANWIQEKTSKNEGLSPHFLQDESIELMHKQGHTVHCSINAHLLPNQDVEGVIRDISLRKKQENELQHAKDIAEFAVQEKSRFLAAASHDLHQPLQALNLFLGATVGIKDISVLEPLLQKAMASSKSLNSLFDAILEISQLDAHALKPISTITNITALLDDIAKEFAPLAKNKGLELRTRWPAGETLVQTDPIIFSRIVRNLVSNAIKYTHQGGILLTIRQRKGHIIVQIWDTGNGMNKHEIKKIFLEFERLENQSSEQGMGLGLSIVNRLSDLLNHPVSVTSRVGRGSCFSIKISNS